jgi:thioredoxin 1
MAFEFTDLNFEQVVQQDQVVMVDFWAEWCGPCKMIAPAVEALAGEFAGKAVIGKMDIDNNPNIPTMLGIRSIPTILFFKNGELVDKQVGLASVEMLRSKINAHLPAPVA